MRLALPTAFLSLTILASCSSRDSRVVSANLPAPSLAGNRMGISAQQNIVVYLPPGYQTSSRRFPVLYFLPNFDCCLWRYTGGSFQRFHLKDAMDRQIAQGAAREMIVVIPNTVHWLGGSCYRNSPLTGNWEDYIAKDLVDYVDRNYRTIREAASRGLAGHGMGGTGALELALKHPDLFGCVYALSPALFDPNGLQDFGILGDQQLRHWQEHLQQWQGLSADARRKSFRDYVQSSLNSPSRAQFFEGLRVSYAAAMAADLSLPYPHIAFPVPNSSGEVDPSLLRKYEGGFGGWREKVTQYLALGHRLRAITIEYGKEDEYQWIRRGADYVSDLMRRLGVPNELVLDEGSHESALGRRLESAMIPAMSRALRNP